MQFFVEFKPQPQGSSRAFIIGGKARITSANAKLKPYRNAVRAVAQAAVETGKYPGLPFGKHKPVAVDFQFTFCKPPSAPKSRTHPVVTPDLDKLIRATCDALTGCVWHDDAQVVILSAAKEYGEQEGVLVRVRSPYGSS